MSGRTIARAIGERGTTVAKTSLKLQAYRQIKAGVILGEVPGGAALSEQTLVDDLSISRTPSREALNMLQHEQLVEIDPKQGWRYASLVHGCDGHLLTTGGAGTVCSKGSEAAYR